MPSDKDRLYIALYARGGAATMPRGEDTYHWAFIIGPKIEGALSRGNRCHVKELSQIVDGALRSTWTYEVRETSMLPTASILARVMICKVKDVARLMYIFANTPIRAGQAGYEAWNCVYWVQEALYLAALDGHALGRGKTDWDYVRDTVMQYVAYKVAEHRYDGQVQFDQSVVATWDAIAGSEVIP